MAGQYASGTSVDAGASRAEIERTLARYGATAFGYMTQESEGASRAAVTFVAHGRQVRLTVEMPSRADRRFTHTPSTKRPRTPEAAYKEWEAETRRVWRALALLVKALLEAVDSGITTFEEAFLPYTIVPGTGRTVHEQVGADMERAIASGEPPRLQIGA